MLSLLTSKFDYNHTISLICKFPFFSFLTSTLDKKKLTQINVHNSENNKMTYLLISNLFPTFCWLIGIQSKCNFVKPRAVRTEHMLVQIWNDRVPANVEETETKEEKKKNQMTTTVCHFTHTHIYTDIHMLFGMTELLRTVGNRDVTEMFLITQ